MQTLPTMCLTTSLPPFLVLKMLAKTLPSRTIRCWYVCWDYRHYSFRRHYQRDEAMTSQWQLIVLRTYHPHPIDPATLLPQRQTIAKRMKLKLSNSNTITKKLDHPQLLMRLHWRNPRQQLRCHVSLIPCCNTIQPWIVCSDRCLKATALRS